MRDFSNLAPNDFDEMSQAELSEYSNWLESENKEFLEELRNAFSAINNADKTVIANPIKMVKAHRLIDAFKKYFSQEPKNDYEIELTSDPVVANTFCVNVRAEGWGDESKYVVNAISLCDEFYVHAQERPDRVWIEFVFNDFYHVQYN